MLSGKADSPPAPRLKVVHIITVLEIGGAQGNTIHTVRHLDEGRFEAHLWCGRGGFLDAHVEEDLGARGRLRFLRRLVRPVHPAADCLAVLELWAALREERPDVVHTHSSKAGILGRLAARLSGVPVVVHTFHGFGFNERQRPLVRALYVLLERWAARLSHSLVFVSESNRALAERLGLGDPARHTLIRSGIPLGRLARVRRGADRRAAREALGLAPERRLVITLSAFKPQKNLLDFIAMARIVASACPEACFVLVGDGEERGALEAAIREAGLAEAFRAPGWLEDPAPLLAASDVFVLTSLWEGLPRALVEAMALGVPAVCYRTDGVSDLLRSEREAREQGDVEGLAAEVIRLLQSPEAAREAAASQEARVTSDFDIDEMVRAQERLYEQASGRRAP